MTAVFLGGSRKLSRLSDTIRHHLDQIVSRKLQVLIGDANGADKAMQQYFADANYADVRVFAVEAHLRNNVGGWPVVLVKAPLRARGRALYESKDRVMAEQAEAGLMLWDGESRGTLANVQHLLKDGKPVAIYHAPRRRFVSVSSVSEFVQKFPLETRGVDAILRADSEQHELIG